MNEEEGLNAAETGGTENAASETNTGEALASGTETEDLPAEKCGESTPVMQGTEESANETAEESATNGEEENVALSETEMAAILADPMFLPFARGKKGDIPTLCRDFREMLAAGGTRVSSHVTASVTARMIPTFSSASPEVALSERQRSLARAAGMTYREYFELASDIPSSIYDHKQKGDS